jgi:hypothetical protein
MYYHGNTVSTVTQLLKPINLRKPEDRDDNDTYRNVWVKLLLLGTKLQKAPLRVGSSLQF